MDLKGKDYLTNGDMDTDSTMHLLEVAHKLKKEHKEGKLSPIMKGRTLATIFQKPSLRTRVSFDVGFMLLGGNVINIRKEEINLGVREPIKDVGRNLSHYVNCIMLRTFAHAEIVELAQWASVPVINGLTDTYHPCQALADIMTVQEKYGTFKGKKLAYIGDGNNVANSLLETCTLVGMDVTVVSPGGYEPPKYVVEKAQEFAKKTGSKISIEKDPQVAVKNAHAVYTDVWASMGQEAEADARRAVFQNYQINSNLMKLAAADCIVMHCLPAHRGEEITDEVFEIHADTIFEQAENRMHAQNAIMACIIP